MSMKLVRHIKTVRVNVYNSDEFKSSDQNLSGLLNEGYELLAVTPITPNNRAYLVYTLCRTEKRA